MEKNGAPLAAPLVILYARIPTALVLGDSSTVSALFQAMNIYAFSKCSNAATLA